MSSWNIFVLPSFWFGPAYVWFMLFRAHSRPSSDWACLGSPWEIYVRKFHADGIRWFNTLDNLKQFIVEPLAPCACLQRPGRKQTNMASSMGREWGKRAWQDKSCIFIILFYCAYIFKYVFLPCSADLFLFLHLLCHLVAKDAARGQRTEGRGGGVFLMWHGGLSLGIDVSFGVIKITKISFAFLGWLCAIERAAPRCPVLDPQFRVPGPRSFR